MRAQHVPTAQGLIPVRVLRMTPSTGAAYDESSDLGRAEQRARPGPDAEELAVEIAEELVA